MLRPEYMKVHIKNCPADIITKYDLKNKISRSGHIFIKIQKGMYGLKQAAILAHNQLIEKLKPFGYRPIPNTMGLWEHESRQTKFCLCVDDFGVKSFNKYDTKHLLDALQSSYKISTDMGGANYCGLTIDWDYTAGHVDISMPGYLDKVLSKYPLPSKNSLNMHPINGPPQHMV